MSVKLKGKCIQWLNGESVVFMDWLSKTNSPHYLLVFMWNRVRYLQMKIMSDLLIQFNREHMSVLSNGSGAMSIDTEYMQGQIEL